MPRELTHIILPLFAGAAAILSGILPLQVAGGVVIMLTLAWPVLGIRERPQVADRPGLPTDQSPYDATDQTESMSPRTAVPTSPPQRRGAGRRSIPSPLPRTSDESAVEDEDEIYAPHVDNIETTVATAEQADQPVRILYPEDMERMRRAIAERDTVVRDLARATSKTEQKALAMELEQLDREIEKYWEPNAPPPRGPRHRREVRPERPTEQPPRQAFER